ncbi:hypothetical protein JCM19240_1501 [Vibrio maritimus]|uniref:Uncharacterized protein n=1 Tax=Vibrio maritimus TaxID=990268 RepID=A0A090TBG5_9VIBR|nr:hypothetical protein JCM19240_1501 [Vibrio maritimus]
MWEIWKARDGAIGGEISTTMAKLTIAKPGLMLSIFEENPHMFRDWLDELQSPMFTDFSGHELDDLNILRTDLIEVMTDYSENGDPSSLSMPKKLNVG